MQPAPIFYPSPNFDDRKGAKVELVILHYTGMESAEAALERLTNAVAKVSCHYLIDEDGKLYRLIPEQDRAWHAGVAHWRGIDDVNAASIGIELVNPGHEFGYRPFPDSQIETLKALIADIRTRQDISAGNIVGHSDVAPARKADPGELFPWADLADDGIGIWPNGKAGAQKHHWRLSPGECGRLVSDLQEELAVIGYGLKVNGRYDDVTRAAVAAFQRHWRPAAVTGIADPDTLDRVTAVAQVSHDTENR